MLVGLLVLYAITVIGVVAFAASVYLPRNPRTGGSLIYFEDIAAMPFESFQVQAGEMPPDAMERQLLETDSRRIRDSQRQDAPGPVGLLPEWPFGCIVGHIAGLGAASEFRLLMTLLRGARAGLKGLAMQQLESALLYPCCPEFYRGNRYFNCRAFLGARSFFRAFASI